MTDSSSETAPAVSTLRRLHTRRRRRVLLGGVVLLAVLTVALHRAAERGRRADFAFDAERTYHINRVVDGDTLVLASGHRVRLLGVDTPETKHPNRAPEPLGPEASAFTTRRVSGHDVRLVFDKQRLDRYDRILAWVFVDGDCLNIELVEAGLSKAVLLSPLRPDLRKALIAAERNAKSAGRGIWQP